MLECSRDLKILIVIAGVEYHPMNYRNMHRQLVSSKTIEAARTKFQIHGCALHWGILPVCYPRPVVLVDTGCNTVSITKM